MAELDMGSIERSRKMLRQVRYECGYLARGRIDDEVIALILAHVATDHPDLAETETGDDIRSLIELVPD
jgi:predicted small metal-binding protein